MYSQLFFKILQINRPKLWSTHILNQRENQVTSYIMLKRIIADGSTKLWSLLYLGKYANNLLDITFLGRGGRSDPRPASGDIHAMVTAGGVFQQKQNKTQNHLDVYQPGIK